MSDHIHGNAKTAAKDSEIRSWLRSKGYNVLEITRVDLDDAGAMRRYLKKLGRLLVDKEFAKSLDENEELVAALGGKSAPAPKKVTATERAVNEKPTVKLSTEHEEVLDLVSGDVRKLVLQLASDGVPAPEPGYPLDDEDGVTVAESELAWPEKLVAYFRNGDQVSAEHFRSRSWTVIVGEELAVDAAAIAGAINA